MGFLCLSTLADAAGIKSVFIQSNSDFITSLKNAHFPTKKLEILCKIEG